MKTRSRSPISITDVSDCETRGWMSTGARSYRHHCGARVTKRGRLWAAIGAAGISFDAHLTANDAMSCLECLDPSVWSSAVASIGYHGGVWIKVGYPDATRQDEVFLSYLRDGEEPPFLRPLFERHLFGRAHCARCLSPMAGLNMRPLREFDCSGVSRNVYITCDCGYPVWSLDARTIYAFAGAMDAAQRSWRRNQRLRAAGGAHTPSEIQAILDLQGNRCIYCNARFANDLRPTKDHLLPIADGGTNWALNIIMACKSCNSRRRDIPFRTYCKLLSRAQNRRILVQLGKRLLAVGISGLPREALEAFDKGLASHDSEHWRFIDIQRESAPARRNAVSKSAASTNE